VHCFERVDRDRKREQEVTRGLIHGRRRSSVEMARLLCLKRERDGFRGSRPVFFRDRPVTIRGTSTLRGGVRATLHPRRRANGEK